MRADRARAARRAPPARSAATRRTRSRPAAAPAPRARRRRRSAPGCARRDADAAGCRSSARPCSDTSVDVRQRPAEPRRGEAEGGRRRHHQHLVGRDVARQHRADAVEERIAGGQHADRAGRAARAPPRPPRRTGSARAAPRRGSAARPAPDAALPPNTISALAIEPARDRRSSPSTPSSPMPTMDSQRRVAAVLGHDRLSDAMRHILILGGTGRSAAARRAARPAAPISRVTLSLAGRTADAAAAARAGAHRRLRRRRRPRGLSCAPSASMC